MSCKYSQLEFSATSVTKHFKDPLCFTRELEVYQRTLSMTPRLLDFHSPDWIKTELVPGKPYLDCDLDIEDIKRLAQTIAGFHLSTLSNGLCLCHWDNQPRNILFHEETFYLIDFSECETSFPEDDITHLLLFWASELDQVTMKLHSDAFIGAYRQLLPLDPKQWQLSLQASIKRFDKRRSLYRHGSDHRFDEVLLSNRSLLESTIR